MSRRSASPPLRKTPGRRYPREGRRRLDHAVLISARKYIKKQIERGIPATDEDHVISLMRDAVQQKYVEIYDRLVEDFEDMHSGREPSTREANKLEDNAERLAVDEVEHEVAQETAEYRGTGINPEITRKPRGRGRHFDRQERQALANEPPPAPNDIASLIADLSEETARLAPAAAAQAKR